MFAKTFHAHTEPQKQFIMQATTEAANVERKRQNLMHKNL